MSKVDVQMVSSEMSGLKDNMWKLSGRVQLMEKFIQKQFGDVFWDFVQEHAADTADYDDLPRSPTPPLAPAVTVTLIQSSTSSGGGAACSSSSSTSIHSSNNSESSSSSSSNNSSTSGGGGPPPPPPLIPASNLAAIASVINGGNGVGGNNHRSISSRFLPKNLSTGKSTSKPVLKAASLSLASSESHYQNNNNHQQQQGAPRIMSTHSLSPEDRKPVRQVVRGGESILKSSLKASPLPTGSATHRVNKSGGGLRAGCTPPTKPLALKRAAPVEFQIDEEEEHDEKRMMNTIENMMGYSNNSNMSSSSNRSVNIIRTSSGIKAETDGYSAAHNGFLREMRPNPCHTRCQNRCHDIWTDGDRMDVFQLYWSIATEDERRQWVAERIERVDMATKKTEYSNFRTCTFKYYFPHPENPRVQVCKNFFLATIDEKRSYVEKIAQEVKGISEHYSIQDIPFRRKNQMKGGGGEEEQRGSNGNNGFGMVNMKHHNQYDGYQMVGWMTGNMDDQDEQDEEEYIVGEGEEEGDGMEMEEMSA